MNQQDTPRTENQVTGRQGAIGVIVDADSRFLVIRRSEFVRAPGRLCFPGGGIEAGETQEQAVVRELQEELGLSVQPVRKLWESSTPSGVLLHWWLTNVADSVKPVANPEEVAEWAWFSEQQILGDARTLKSNREFLFAVRKNAISLRA